MFSFGLEPDIGRLQIQRCNLKLLIRGFVTAWTTKSERTGTEHNVRVLLVPTPYSVVEEHLVEVSSIKVRRFVAGAMHKLSRRKTNRADITEMTRKLSQET